MRKEYYNCSELIAALKVTNDVCSIIGYNKDNGNIRYNLQHYKGVICYNRGFNLCANFQMHKISASNLRDLFKKCGCMLVYIIDFSDNNFRNACNYDNFIKIHNKEYEIND